MPLLTAPGASLLLLNHLATQLKMLNLFHHLSSLATSFKKKMLSQLLPKSQT